MFVIVLVFDVEGLIVWFMLLGGLLSGLVLEGGVEVVLDWMLVVVLLLLLIGVFVVVLVGLEVLFIVMLDEILVLVLLFGEVWGGLVVTLRLGVPVVVFAVGLVDMLTGVLVVLIGGLTWVLMLLVELVGGMMGVFVILEDGIVGLDVLVGMLMLLRMNWIRRPFFILIRKSNISLINKPIFRLLKNGGN